MKTGISQYLIRAVILLGGRFSYILSLSLILLYGCQLNKNMIVGSWTQPIPGQSDQVQGIRLETEGSASSINMRTLLYETWEQKGMKLILTGKSIGNGQTISFSDTFGIEKLTADTMILSKETFEIVYIRSTI